MTLTKTKNVKYLILLYYFIFGLLPGIPLDVPSSFFI
jgi:hypothetical protein